MWEITVAYGDKEIGLGVFDEWPDVVAALKKMKPGDAVDQITITLVVK
jgi:hypothetical protein